MTQKIELENFNTSLAWLLLSSSAVDAGWSYYGDRPELNLELGGNLVGEETLSRIVNSCEGGCPSTRGQLRSLTNDYQIPALSRLREEYANLLDEGLITESRIKNYEEIFDQLEARMHTPRRERGSSLLRRDGLTRMAMDMWYH